MKLFLYKASNAPIVVILRRGRKRTEWEMIRWNMDTDEFTRGQWLLGKHMNGEKQAISPCGKYFAYHYSKFNPFETHGVVSLVPNFTGLYHNNTEFSGEKVFIHFDQDGSICGPSMEKKGNIDIPFSGKPGELGNHTGYISEKIWMDPRGRKVSTEAGKLFVNDFVYDTDLQAFTPMLLLKMDC